MNEKPSYQELEQEIKRLEKKITDQTNIEKELRSSKKKYKDMLLLFRRLTDNAPDLIWAKDIEDRYLFANKAICDKLLMCQSTQEPLGRNDIFFADRERETGYDHTFGEICVNSDQIVKSLNRPKRFLEDGQVRGEYLALDVHKAPFYDDRGEMIGTVGCGRDVTKEVQIEKQLKQSEHRFKELFESVSTISIYGYDENRKVTFWNRASETLYGYTKQEALNQNIDELIVPDNQVEEIGALHSRWLEKGLKIPPKARVLNDKSGNQVPVFCTHVMNETQTGKEVFCFAIDRSPMEESEKERKQLQSQLRQSQKMEAIGTLAGGIAHDFNNILQAISGFTDLMLMNEDRDEEELFNLQEISSAALRARELIRQLLFFSRKADTQKTPVNLNYCVEQAIRMLEKTIPKMIQIKTCFKNDLKNTYADPVQIEQVLLNLGSNAADAMPEGGQFMVETSNESIDAEFVQNNIGAEPGEYVCLNVRDTGQGMDEKTLKNMYEPFYTTKGVGQGTGLGLASVYGIVKNHGGYITCASVPGKGTEFKIYLPVLEYTGKNSDSFQDEYISGTETILVVDDEAPVRTFVTKTLHKFGYKTIQAENGEEALAAYGNPLIHIDLILMDINMPGMGGNKCCMELFNIDPDVRIIISSGYHNAVKSDPAIQSQISGYINKPYKIDNLLKEIRSVLDR